MTQKDLEISRLRSVAQNRWLRPVEVLFILQNCDDDLITAESPNKPPSGSLLLFNRRVLRFFRNDGHQWRRKKDGRTGLEAHEKLKVGNVDKLNCYYAHGEQNPSFQRRCYWILDPAWEHIVLVHYRDVGQGCQNTPAKVSESSTASPYALDSVGNMKIEGTADLAFSPVSREVVSCESSAGPANDDVGAYDYLSEGCDASSVPHFNQALKDLEQELCSDDDDYHLYKERVPPHFRTDCSQTESHIDKHGRSGYSGQDDSNSSMVHSSGNNQNMILQPSDSERYLGGNNSSMFWEEILGLTASNWPRDCPQEKTYEEISSGRMSMAGNVFLPDVMKQTDFQIRPETSSRSRVQEDSRAQNRDYSEDYNVTQLHLSAAEKILLGPDSPVEISTSLKHIQGFEDTSCGDSSVPKEETTIDWMFKNRMKFPNGNRSYLSEFSDTMINLSQRQLFSIREISPEWGYSSESTKVIIIGEFVCNPLQHDWKVMFGNVEVPVKIIQNGVIQCQTPSHLPGRVLLCLTMGNQESCSEVREFEYRAKPEVSDSSSNQKKNAHDLNLLLVRLGEILLNKTGEIDHSQSKDTFDASVWLLEELLKDKLNQWIASKTPKGQQGGCSLTREEQNIIHVVSGLGYEWALGPLLNAGIGLNFRDSNGWTALHWAARFGREAMVAALLAAGASTLAVTDPSNMDPSGKTPASIAADYDHKGLAGYLSEASLTGHLSSLSMEECEISKRSPELAADKAVESISERNIEIDSDATEDQLSLKDSLAAVRNAAQAAARIQSAFRAHSFLKRQVKGQTFDGLTQKEIHDLSAASKALRGQALQSAALCIQRKYRGWRGRKYFLSLRQHVVKIQAHVRGHQVRKKYKEFIWTVGVIEKVVLRWRRKGAGLRGFKIESEAIDEESDSEDDILKVFRKQKVDAAIDEAMKRVLSVVESPEARRQYRRMLESYHLAKAELDGAGESTSSAGVDCGVELPDEEAMVFDSLDSLWATLDGAEPS